MLTVILAFGDVVSLRLIIVMDFTLSLNSLTP